MQGQSQANRPRILVNFLFIALLAALSVLFFASVRNNTFWHPSDYQYLERALLVEQSWHELFVATPDETFQPLVNLIFYLEHRLFGTNASAYYLFNIFLHALNAYLVFLVVATLLKDRTIAVVSSLLFVFAVGNYGKAVMVVSGVSDLVIACLTLSTLLFYFKNELKAGDRLLSGWFIACLVAFFLSLMSKATSFSVLGCMVAFNFFFREETGRRVFHRNFLILAAFALVVLIVKLSLIPVIPGKTDLLSIWSYSLYKNFASYLVRMVFPIHVSKIVSDSGPVVLFVYELATAIRVLIFLTIVSYSVFGFIFGNRAIRFFIAWTYITVLPFCFFQFPQDWLNIRYLYLVSIGFSMILASGTALAGRLLYQKAWRRFLPYVVPLFFVLLSQFIISHLDGNYEIQAKSERMVAAREAFMEKYERAHAADKP